MKNKITPFLWFDHQAEEAVRFYLSVFKQGKILGIARYPEGSPGRAGSVMTVEFELFGQHYTALNGGPHFQFSEAFSLVVHCKTQREVDTYWKQLVAGGGKYSQCGWLKDRFGFSWQIVPDALFELMSTEDPEQSTRVMHAMLKMRKMDIAKLKAAAKKKAKKR